MRDRRAKRKRDGDKDPRQKQLTVDAYRLAPAQGVLWHLACHDDPTSVICAGDSIRRTFTHGWHSRGTSGFLVTELRRFIAEATSGRR
jgi:hypothetical protein